MAVEDLGAVRASGGRSRQVRWDSKTGEILVEGKPGIFGEGNMKRIGLTTKNRGEAINYAKEWLEADISR